MGFLPEAKCSFFSLSLSNCPRGKKVTATFGWLTSDFTALRAEKKLLQKDGRPRNFAYFNLFRFLLPIPSQHTKMLNIFVRYILLFLVIVVTVGLQLMSLSNVVNNRVGDDQNALKNYINIYVTVCGISFAVMIFVLGKLFTSDLPWHLKEQPGNKRFIHAWGFYPDLIAVFSGFRIGGKRWILTGMALTFIACFSLVKDVWLTQSIKIRPHTSVSEPRNVSVGTLHGGFEASNTQLYRKGYLGVFAAEAIMGLRGSTALHLDGDGEYIWSPWLIDPQVSEIVIENYSTIGLRPSCRLLERSEVNVTTLNDGSLKIDIPDTLFNASDPATLYVNGNPIYTTWNATTVQSNATGQSVVTTPDYIVNYHVFSTNVHDNTNKTYTYRPPKNSTYGLDFISYVYGCKVDIPQYNISGHVSSNVGPSLDRLNMTRKVLVSDILDDTPNFNQLVYAANQGFGDTLRYQSIGTNMEICVPIRCWMLDSALGLETGYNSTRDGPTTGIIYEQGWVHMSPALLEYKIAQSIGYILSPSVITNTESIMAKSITHDFVIDTTGRYVFVGIGIELVLIMLAIGFYITSVSDFSQGHGDDLMHLVTLLRPDGVNNHHQELDPLTGECAASRPLFFFVLVAPVILIV